MVDGIYDEVRRWRQINMDWCRTKQSVVPSKYIINLYDDKRFNAV